MPEKPSLVTAHIARTTFSNQGYVPDKPMGLVANAESAEWIKMGIG